MINLPTNFEVSTFTQYEDTKGNGKCSNWGGLEVRGHWRSPVMLPFDRVHTLSYWTNRNYVSVLYRYGVTVSYLSKVVYFNLPYLHLALPLGWPHSNFTQTFGTRKLESPRIIWSCLHDPKLAILILYRCVTDTHRHVMTAYTVIPARNLLKLPYIVFYEKTHILLWW